MSQVEKVAIIGLDCGDPELVFDRWADDLPNLRRLIESGLHGDLQSCVPPLPVPAWSCLASGKDPGVLGLYGPRNRRDWSYENLSWASNLEMRQPRLWDQVGRAGKSSIIIGVPQTFPIVRPPRGCLVTCSMAQRTDNPYTHPPELADEIADLVGEYRLDVPDPGTKDEQELLEEVRALGRQRFKVCRHLATTRPWTLLWMVEPGLSNIQHWFWQCMDPTHRQHQAGHPLAGAIHDYYVHIDREIGGLLDLFELERTAVWVVSPYGVKRLDGGFCLNDWLIREGLLTMKTPVTERRDFDLADIDWSKTKVWGAGGYFGQCFINQMEREPRGIVRPEEYEALRDELIAKLEALPDHEGRSLGNRAYKPGQLYDGTQGCPPDLIVVFGDSHWRSVAAVGNPDVYTFESGMPADEANPAVRGMYVLSHPSLTPARQDATLYDVVPTTLELLRLPVPRGLRGRSLATS